MICGFKSVTSFAKKWKTAVRGRQAVRKLSTFYRQGTAFAASGTGASRISEGCFGPRKWSYVRAAGMANRVRICRSVVPVAGADRRPAFQPAMSVRPHAAADGKVVRNRVCRGKKSGFGSARNPVFRFSAAEGTAARFDRHTPKNEHAPWHSPQGMQVFGFRAQQRSYRYARLPNFSPSFPASTVMTLPRSIRPARISFDSSLTR